MWPELELVTGPVHTGKTTRLAARVAAAPGACCGLLAPVDVAGLRYLRCAVSGEQRRLSCGAEAPDAVAVGPYHFHEGVFTWGRVLLAAHDAAFPRRTLIVDELGKLELRGAGLAPVCWRVLARRRANGQPALVVVRDSLVAAVRERLAE